MSSRSLRRLLCCAGGGLGLSLGAAPVAFDLPAESAPQALLAFSHQARADVLFSFDELQPITAHAVQGKFEPEDALNRLLRNTGFAARRSLLGKFVVARAARPTGSVEGRVLLPDGRPARGARIVLLGTRLKAEADENGRFVFPAVPPGEYRLFAGSAGYRPLEQAAVRVGANESTALRPLRLQFASDITELEPYLVKERIDRLLIGEGVGAPPRHAGGNLDLPRTEDNALPFTLFTREQIDRSGVVQLNEFFQRELLDGSSAAPPPEANGNSASYVTGSSNLSLRGYSSNETVVLLNGRRLPETFTPGTGALGPPDVNLIPLALVQQIEVLPVSASALYSGNAVGGVINIVLRPDAEGTEIRTTYTNALGGFNAPQSSVSLQHGRTLLGGKLHLRLNAAFTRTDPAVESELGYQARRPVDPVGLQARATPNVASADGSPLFGPGTPAFTSVAPGADATSGLGAFAGRAGVRSTGLFDTPGGIASSFNSRDYPYGREERRSTWFGSAVYDAFPWLQLGLDASYARTDIHRGYDLFVGNLTVPAGSPFNPFGQPVQVALNEIAPRLGADYSEAKVDTYSFTTSALVKLPGEWKVTLDGEYAGNVARYRGFVRADPARWQELVAAGQYNPLRDSQVFGPPAAFYDRVLVYYGGPGRFVTLGDYDTLSGTVRLTNEALRLPTGQGTINVGGDYTRQRLAPYDEEPRFADGTPGGELVHWTGRTLERMSAFGELQAPLIPAGRLPWFIKSVESDFAVRYNVSAQSNETSFAPTAGFKVDLAGGFSLRGSYTTSNRFPTAVMSSRLAAGAGGGSTADLVRIFDPLRGENYDVESKVAINSDLRPEAAATQTAGIVWQHGKQHRFRASVDFADTTKVNEFITLEPQAALNLETLFADRIIRDVPMPSGPARVSSVLVGSINVSRRHSQNWNTAFDYNWDGFLGGTFELRGRWVWYQRYERRVFPTSPLVDELDAPDGTAAGVLRHRVSVGTAWSNRRFGFGVDSHYLSSRILPAAEWPAQGGDHIKSYWQFDAFAQADLSRWLPARLKRYNLSTQLRVNNLSNFAFPKYVNDSSGAGVQAYGDWRGRTYSLSTTITF